MNITTIVPPPSDALVVTLEQVYDHLRLVPEDSPPTHPQDDMLTRLIKVATGDAESLCRADGAAAYGSLPVSRMLLQR
jgi:hypothetical protein